MKTRCKTDASLSVAATVMAEDICRGDFVAVLNESIDVPSYLWFPCDGLAPDEHVRLKFVPEEAGRPQRVIAICLPFVYTECANGDVQTMDVRTMQIVRLDPDCAKTVWKKLRKKNRKRR